MSSRSALLETYTAHKNHRGWQKWSSGLPLYANPQLSNGEKVLNKFRLVIMMLFGVVIKIKNENRNILQKCQFGMLSFETEMSFEVNPKCSLIIL